MATGGRVDCPGCKRAGTSTADASVADSSNPLRRGTAFKSFTLSLLFVSPTLALSGAPRGATRAAFQHGA